MCSGCILQKQGKRCLKGSCAKSPLRMHDMERYAPYFVPHFHVVLRFRRRRSRDVEELLCSACQICEQPLICAGLTLAFLFLLKKKKKEPQIKLLMSHSGWLQTSERFKTSFHRDTSGLEKKLAKKKKKNISKKNQCSGSKGNAALAARESIPYLGFTGLRLLESTTAVHTGRASLL